MADVTNDKCRERMDALREAQNEKFRDQNDRFREIEKRLKALENGSPNPQPTGKLKCILGSSSAYDWYGGLFRLLEAVNNGGGNAVRISAHGYAWMPGMTNPHIRRADGYDLQYFNPDWKAETDRCIRYKEQNNMHLICDVAHDNVSVSHRENWNRCALNGAINTIGHPLSGVDYEGRADEKGDKTDPVNACEGVYKYLHGLNGSNPDWDYPKSALGEAQRGYWRGVKNWLNEFYTKMTWCTGNELPSRTMEKMIMDWILDAHALNQVQIILNGYYWYSETSEQLLADPVKRLMLQYPKLVLRIHHWGAPSLGRPEFNGRNIYNRLADLFAEYKHVRFLASSDGVKWGSGGRGVGRPTFAQEVEAMELAFSYPNCIGFEGKTLDEADTTEYIRRVF